MAVDLSGVNTMNIALQRDTKAAKTTKNFAQAQTNLDEAINAYLDQLPSSPGGGSGSDRFPDKIVNPGQSLQTVIDASPNGTYIGLGAGVHAWNSVPDFSNKSAIRVEGEGGIGYNEDEAWGTVIRPNYSGPCFKDTGVGVKHAGTHFRYLNLRPTSNNAVGFLVRNVNGMRIRDCSGKGNFAAFVDSDALGVASGGDCAYNKLVDCRFVNKQPNGKGFLQNNGFWWLEDDNWDLDGTSPNAIVNLAGNLSIRGGKANHAGTHIYSSGNSVDVMGMHMEQAPYTGAFIIVVEKGSNTLYGAGTYHKFIGNTLTPHDDAYAPGAKLVRFGPGTYANNFPRAFNNTAYDKAGSFVNEGADGDAVFAP